jgi:hypothetical protein
LAPILGQEPEGPLFTADQMRAERLRCYELGVAAERERKLCKTMDKDQVIEKLWENSGHGTRRQDVEAAYEAGAAAERERCAKLCEQEICACCWDDDAQAAAEHLAAEIRK